MANVFNPRTWYGNTDGEWPDIGEVQDAERVYSKGDDERSGPPHGSADEWDFGAYLAAAGPDPCPPVFVQGVAFPSNGGFAEIFGPDQRQPLIKWSDELWYVQSLEDTSQFWTFEPDTSGRPCGYPAFAKCTTTDGPPFFNLIDPDVRQLANFGDCLNGTLEAEGTLIRTICSFNVPT